MIKCASASASPDVIVHELHVHVIQEDEIIPEFFQKYIEGICVPNIPCSIQDTMVYIPDAKEQYQILEMIHDILEKIPLEPVFVSKIIGFLIEHDIDTVNQILSAYQQYLHAQEYLQHILS